MSSTEKPKLTEQQQIERLANKGVQFEIMSKDDAVDYLTKNNNYFKLTAYRKTFVKYLGGKNEGKYIGLDFAHLKDLAIIDMRLRYALLHLALDIEHYAKVKLIKTITESDDDGYCAVKGFIDSLNEQQHDTFIREIDRNRDNPYCGAIIQKYDGDYPIWAFVEIIPFGRLVAFYRYCADYLNDSALADDHYLLLSAKGLRNAAAHSNCIINDLSRGTSVRRTNNAVINALAKISGISKETRRKKLSNARIQQIVTLLYSHKKFVTSEGVHNHQCEVLHDVVDRMFHHIDYYATNDTITTTFNFIKLVVDNWFPVAYNSDTKKK